MKIFGKSGISQFMVIIAITLMAVSLIAFFIYFSTKSPIDIIPGG